MATTWIVCDVDPTKEDQYTVTYNPQDGSSTASLLQTWLVECDAASTVSLAGAATKSNPVEAATASVSGGKAIPQDGTSVTLSGFTGTVTNVMPRRIGPTTFHVQVKADWKYQPTKTGKFNVSIDVDGVSDTQDAYYDKDNRPVVNSAGCTFDPSIKQELYDEVFNISYSTTTDQSAAFAAVRGKVNSSSISFAIQGIGRTFSARGLKCLTAKQSADLPLGSGDPTFKCTVSFGARTDGWQIKVLDQGFYTLDPTTNKLNNVLDEHGNDMNAQAMLDGSGNQLEPGSDPTYLTFHSKLRPISLAYLLDWHKGTSGRTNCKIHGASREKIVDFIHGQQATPNDNTGSRSVRRSFNERGFWSKITCYKSLSTDQWKYSFVEMQRTATGWEIHPKGRMGNACSTTFALNAVEAFNPSDTYFGNSQPVAGSQHLEPVRGEPIVWMRQDFPTVESVKDNRPPVYTFAYENAVSSDVPATDTCDCSPSGPDFCLYTFVCEWDCVGESWSPSLSKISRLRTHSRGCGDMDAMRRPSRCTALLHYRGRRSDAEVDECDNWPATPPQPGFAPHCGSSSSSSASSTSQSSGQALCVYLWTVSYDCNAESWGTPVLSATNCPCSPRLSWETGTAQDRSMRIGSRLGTHARDRGTRTVARIFQRHRAACRVGRLIVRRRHRLHLLHHLVMVVHRHRLHHLVMVVHHRQAALVPVFTRAI